MKRILVTGGAGYVGSRVARVLDKKGFAVRVIDRVQNSDFRGQNLGIEEVVGDLRDKGLLLKVLKRVDLVVHLAANIGSMSYMDNYPADILADNASIDSVLYPALITAGVKKILYSSSSMVFQHPHDFPYQESDMSTIHLPTNVYGFSKLIGEYFCRAFHEQYGLEYVIVRYHNIYGPGEKSKISDLPAALPAGRQGSRHQIKDANTSGFIHVLPALLEKVLSGQYPLELLGGINDTRPFTYIDDAVDATVLLVEQLLQNNMKVINEDFNIGPKAATKILDLAELIWKLYGDSRPFEYVVRDVKTTTAKRREMDPRKIREAIGWEAAVSLEEGVKRTGEWMKGQIGR
jgi:nucleoside-diphosphate-sugar epimerase